MGSDTTPCIICKAPTGRMCKCGSEDEVRVDTLVSCPKCGGTGGYYFNKVIKHAYNGAWETPESNWDAKEECADDTLLYADKTVVCADCGKRISRKLMGR